MGEKHQASESSRMTTTTDKGKSHTDEELLAIVDAATRREWSADTPCFDQKIPIRGGITAYGRPYVIAHVNRPGSSYAGQAAKDAAFIATFDPPTVRSLIERAVAAEHQVKGYQHHLRECEQIAGKALGYPWFKDDQKNFPGTTEADGVCVDDHVGDTIVAELADALKAAEDRAYQAEKREEETSGLLDEMRRQLTMAQDEREAAEARALAAEEALKAYQAAYTWTLGDGGRRSWCVDPVKLAAAHDLASSTEAQS